MLSIQDLRKVIKDASTEADAIQIYIDREVENLRSPSDDIFGAVNPESLRPTATKMVKFLRRSR